MMKPTFIDVSEIKYLHCWNCGKQVSTGFYPVETDTPGKGLIVRAVIECPECISREKEREESDR